MLGGSADGSIELLPNGKISKACLPQQHLDLNHMNRTYILQVQQGGFPAGGSG